MSTPATDPNEDVAPDQRIQGGPDDAFTANAEDDATSDGTPDDSDDARDDEKALGPSPDLT